MKEISVIGATSPLGVSLVSKLSESGHSLTISHRNRKNIPGEWIENSLMHFEELDLTTEFGSTAFESEIIVWLAHIDAGRYNEQETEINLRAFDRFLRHIDQEKTRKLIFISSGGSVYGHPEKLPISEEHPRLPLSTYGKTKCALENKLIEFGRTTEIHTAILRPGNIYGFEHPHRNSKGVVGAFLRSLESGATFTLIHGGQTIRDFVHVDDVCDAIVCAIESKQNHIIWNVSTGNGHSILEVLKAILQNTGSKMPPIIDHENFDSDVLTSILSPDRIWNEADWIAKIDLDSGIGCTVKNWMSIMLESEGSI